jgi:hypothetical protein
VRSALSGKLRETKTTSTAKPHFVREFGVGIISSRSAALPEFHREPYWSGGLAAVGAVPFVVKRMTPD